MSLSGKLLASALAQGLSGQRCVSAWLGFGNVLFLGLGPAPIQPRDDHGRRTVPPAEIQTGMALWRVVGRETAGLTDNRDAAARAIEALIGLPVTAWLLTDGSGLEIDFGSIARLEILSPPVADPEWPDLHEWWIALPDGRFVGVGQGGRVVAGLMNLPACDMDGQPSLAPDPPS